MNKLGNLRSRTVFLLSSHRVYDYEILKVKEKSTKIDRTRVRKLSTKKHKSDFSNDNCGYKQIFYTDTLKHM